MLKYLGALYESMTEVSPDEAIGALMIGLVLALGFAGLCVLAFKKSANPYPLVCGLIFAVSASSLMIGVGHSRSKYIGASRLVGWGRLRSDEIPRPGVSAAPVSPYDRPPVMPRGRGGRRWIMEADGDGNGRITPEEAAQFIRNADRTGKGWVGLSDLERPRGGPPGPTAVTQGLPPAGSPAPHRSDF